MVPVTRSVSIEHGHVMVATQWRFRDCLIPRPRLDEPSKRKRKGRLGC